MQYLNTLLFASFLSLILGLEQAAAQCPMGYSQIVVHINPDTYPNETSWDIKDTSNTIIASGTINNDTFCYPTGVLLYFTIYDSYGDGMCCGYGNGSYQVYVDGNLVASGGTFTYSETITFNYPSGFMGQQLIDAFGQLLHHCDGSAPLASAQLNALALTIEQNQYYMGENLSVISAAFDAIECYETQLGPLFLNANTTNGFPNTPGAQDGLEYDRVMFLLQQKFLDRVYTKEKVSAYHTFLSGKKYLTSAYFPGACPLPVDSSQVYTATVNASMPSSWGMPSAWSSMPARRPTGYYLSPGCVAKVKVPPVMSNAGFKILVGAHPESNHAIGTLRRLFKVFSEYEITDTVTLVANPLGGGIYIVTPYQAALGLQQIELTNVVPAPFFSAKSFHATSLSEWLNVQRNHPAPWADFESEKFMMQVPTSFIYNYNDPIALMADWDARMDVVSNLMGRPLVRNNVVLYVMQDVRILHNGYLGIGYPQINTTYDPYSTQNGNSQHYFLVPGSQSLSDDEFHELGHSELMDKFPGEQEAIVNLLHAAVNNQLYGMDLDTAFGKSFNNQYWLGRDQAATHWMVTHNFRAGNPMDISNTTKDEVRYQHRGYGKYIEIAALFGWDTHHDYYYKINTDFNNGIPLGSLGEIDSRILRWSIAADADLRPLIHFWGIQPQDSAALAQAIADHNLHPSLPICNRLLHYQSLIPMDNAQFAQHALEFFNGPVPPGGDPDYGSGWYNIWLSQYNNSHGDSAFVAMQNIIDAYFPNGCMVSTDQPAAEEQSEISVFPNPNTGRFILSIPNFEEAEITVTNLLGQQVLQMQALQRTTELNMEQSGVFLVRITTKKGRFTKSVVVNR